MKLLLHIPANQFSVGSIRQNCAFYTTIIVGFMIIIVQLNPGKETGIRKAALGAGLKVVGVFKYAGKTVYRFIKKTKKKH